MKSAGRGFSLSVGGLKFTVDPVAVFFVAMNIASSVGIVSLNKIIFSKYQYPFGTWL
jgi:hypothetical protein